MKKILSVVISTALLCVTSSVLAQSRNGPLYAGVDLGYGHFSRSLSDDASRSVRSGSISYGVGLGYDFTSWFALELAYTDNGDFISSEGIACPGSCPPDGPAFEEVVTSAKSHGVNAVIGWPITQRVRINALAGYTQRKVRISQTGLSQKLDGALLGVGVNGALTRSVDLRLQWNIAVLGKENLETAWEQHLKGTTSVASLGVKVRF